ncbi:hypothetical protein F7725_017959 [Dissostichus mawsoni]|uniref:Uncharacterized protein n=1 Tax=Dissostichus mawsoni TaxID=36200 RepID=A0A7J5XQ99_DISMA|nr:hypothetical protein F7725_017959 [Dissostichus mawsoni]
MEMPSDLVWGRQAETLSDLLLYVPSSHGSQIVSFVLLLLLLCGSASSMLLGWVESPGYPNGYPPRASLNWSRCASKDFDECVNDEDSGCTQFCHNYIGGYHCSCRHGYHLDVDKRTCTVACAEDLSGLKEGEISSPSWPASYAENAHCQYSLSVEPTLQLELLFSQVFDVEQSPDGQCIDTLRIETHSETLGSFCGNTPPPSPFLTHSHRVQIHFTSDGYGTNKGFSLAFRTREDGILQLVESDNTQTKYKDQIQFHCSSKYYTLEGDDTYTCSASGQGRGGATLISDRWAVTAAHVVEGGRVNLGPNLLPVCLPQSNRGLVDGDHGTVSGWGGTEKAGISQILKYAHIDIYSSTVCQNTPITPKTMMFTRNMFCAGSTTADSCRRDSGGPLVMPMMSEGNEPYYLTGIVSWGASCRQKQFKGYYVKVENYVAWIQETID